MTETGKATSTPTANLTEVALAPRPEPGQPWKCPAGAIWNCGCIESHTRAWQEPDPTKETRLTWISCGCVPCKEKCVALAIDMHAQHPDGGYEHTIWRWNQDLLKAQMHRAEVDRINESRARHALHRQNAANAKAKQGPWEFTLTYSPAKHGWSADEAKDAMRSAVERLTRYYREEIEEFHAVGEYTQAGAPHVHAWYKLDGGRKMTTKSFKRAYPIWNERAKMGRGHEGGHHEPVKRTSDFAGYVEKHLETAWLQIDITNAVSEEASHHPSQDDHPSEADDDTSTDSTDDSG